MASLRKIAGSWVLDWRESGERKRTVLGRVGEFPERDARRLFKQKQLELAAGFRILNAPAAPTFGTFVADYLTWHGAEHPDSHYRIKQIVDDYLLPAFEFTALDAIRPREVEAWKQRRLSRRKGKDGEPPKAATVSKELRTLKAILNRAVAWEVIARNPIEHVEGPKLLDSKPPRFYTVAELGALYEACRTNAEKYETVNRAACWRLYVNTGMRRMEGLLLRRAWIGRDAMKILSSDEHRTKSGKWREIPLTDGARAALEELPKDGDYVLPRVRPESLSRAFLKDAGRATLEGGIHTLRHTYISHLVMAGVSLRVVQVLAGHSTIAVTEQYAHLAPGYLQNAGRAISL